MQSIVTLIARTVVRSGVYFGMNKIGKKGGTLAIVLVCLGAIGTLYYLG